MIPGSLGFFLGEARRNFGRHPGIAVISIGSIAISLVALGAFLLIAMNLSPAVQSLQSSVEIVAFLEDGLAPSRVEEIGRSIREISDVQEARFKSKADALAEFCADPQMKEWVRTVGVNPLPASFEIRVIREANEPSRTARIADALAAIAGIEEVRYPKEWVGRLFSGLAVVRSIGFAFGLALCLGAVIVISNTIRLSILARQQEFYIMRLVGAGTAVIRGPYIAEGLFLGLIGAACALGILYAAFLYLTAGPATSGAFFFPLPIASAFVGAGGLLGLIGSAFSLTRMSR